MKRAYMSRGDRSFDRNADSGAAGLKRVKSRRTRPGHGEPPKRALDNSDLDALSRCPLYSALPVLAQAELTSRLSRRRCEARQFLIREGEPCDAVHFVTRGCFKAISTSLDGDELVVTFLVPGDLAGIVSSADGGPATMSAVALEDSEVFSLPADEMKKLTMEVPEFAVALIQTYSSRLRSVGERLEDAYFYDLETRMARCLVKLAEHCGVETRRGVTIDVPLSQSELAGMLGAGRSRVNQLLNHYEDEGLIQLSRRSVTIVEFDDLRRRARYDGGA